MAADETATMPDFGVKPLTTQQERVWRYLKSGSTLTNLVALTALQVGSLSSRVAELRKLGYPITDRLATDDFGRDYKKYDTEYRDAEGPLDVG